MARKWIINDNEIIVGNVELHLELHEDNSKTIGGGYWNWLRREKKFYFFGASQDFGQVTREQFEAALKESPFLSQHIRDCEIFFSSKSKWENVILEELLPLPQESE